ncbi:MAG: uroporphyrinogen-III C-methyltransferase [Deltaproteobacteria bacterium 37-65-8]|nr:uroporphyrinogen-III C-methyltransferase [Deltaproteobacteria bacterium]OYV95941.1 MAG: uroporphyrinogen-III C-methyltransferase [Deltaproteobacteria bacterium 37-65-8]HQT98205.1 uroporphyrinogen-III C-methyltransferase [Thermodesulfobacteriota bacterium]
MSALRRYLPAFHDVLGARVLVVGAGAVGTRKIETLLAGGARVTVVAKEFSRSVEDRAARGDLTVHRGEFHSGQMEGAELVFAATPDRALNRRVSAEARRRRIPVNVADSPEECTFLLPAVIRGDEFTVAISTGGRHPGAAKAVREFIEEHRAEISVRLERGRRRKRIAAEPGKVYIVGAGPGDPDLLTVRALGLLRSADAVIHDYLVPREILSLAPAKAVRISFARRGRTAGHGAILKQNAIHEAMVRLAREGKSVVRLKSGDPLVFGRGGEEAEHLSREGIPFEIVPGITAAMGCAAAAAIPLTHRERSSSVTFVAGHETEEKGGSAVDWSLLPKDGTLAIYMGVGRVAAIAGELGGAGFPPETPFAIVENGSRVQQRILRGTLSDLPRIALGSGVRSPAILFVGRTAALLPYENTEETSDEPVAQSV